MLGATIKGLIFVTSVALGDENLGSPQDLDDTPLAIKRSDDLNVKGFDIETEPATYDVNTPTIYAAETPTFDIFTTLQKQLDFQLENNQEFVTLLKEIGILQPNGSDILEMMTSTTKETLPVNLTHTDTDTMETNARTIAEGRTQVFSLLEAEHIRKQVMQQNNSGVLWPVEETITLAGEETNHRRRGEDGQTSRKKSMVESLSEKGNEPTETTPNHDADFITYLSGVHNDADTEVPSVCHQDKEEGLCRAYLPRWYFNATDATCYRFIYGGCLGNKNNFNKEHKCYAACKGKIQCPKDPQKVCRMSESACKNATCPEYPEAECVVLPCTCEAVFEDIAGHMVNCSSPYNYSAISEGGDSDVSGEQDSNVTDVEERARVPRNEFNEYKKVAMWSMISTSFVLILVVVGIGYYRWRRSVGVYRAFASSSNTKDKSLDSKRESFTEYSTTKPDDGSGV